MANIRLSEALKLEYQRLFDSCVINPGKAVAVNRIVSPLSANKSRYSAVGDPLGIPWYFIAVIHNMESSQNFTRHLHNGDRLTARTVQVPANRPRTGSPPFTWEESATDALKMKKLHQWQDWSVAGMLYKLEGYNGWGYRKYHPETLSPYLWGFSSHYTSGKYVADGRWSDTAVSRQCGAAVILRRMAEQSLIELELPVVSTAVRRSINQGLPLIRYSSRGKLPYAKDLQEFLNQFPGVYVKPDGWPGENTSNAFKSVTGNYLSGDPRNV